MLHSDEFRRCLIDMDVTGARKLWAHVSPHLSQPKTNHDTEMMLHSARTQADSIPLKLRAYSHRWLLDSGYPSSLPDHLKPQAERLYPKITEAVGLSINTKSSLLKPAMLEVRRAMENAVHEAVADRISLSDKRVSVMMRSARDKIIRKLFGRIYGQTS